MGHPVGGGNGAEGAGQKERGRLSHSHTGNQLVGEMADSEEKKLVEGLSGARACPENTGRVAVSAVPIGVSAGKAHTRWSDGGEWSMTRGTDEDH